LEINGPKKRNVIAYLRKSPKKYALFIAGRFFYKLELLQKNSGSFWKGTTLSLPPSLVQQPILDILSGRQFVSRDKISMEELFQYLPQAIIVSKDLRES
jgi:maltooligosyltrehalose synthase